MSRNQSMGPVQVLSNDPAAINLALMQVQERFDELKGLHGRAEVWDRVRVDDPTESQDALTLGRIQDAETVSNTTFLAAGAAGLVIGTPGTSYVEVSASLRQRINFTAQQPLEARVTIVGWGTQAGTGKGIAITRSDGTVICEVAWDGSSEGPQSGDYTAVTLETDQTVQVRAKGSSASETLLVSRINLDMRYRISVL